MSPEATGISKFQQFFVLFPSISASPLADKCFREVRAFSVGKSKTQIEKKLFYALTFERFIPSYER